MRDALICFPAPFIDSLSKIASSSIARSFKAFAIDTLKALPYTALTQERIIVSKKKMFSLNKVALNWKTIDPMV